MERSDIQVWDIDIDDEKVAYIATKGVAPEDVFEVLEFEPRFFLRNQEWGIYNMIGPNRSGRFLVVGIQPVTEHLFRLVTAYWNTDGRAEANYRERV